MADLQEMLSLSGGLHAVDVRDGRSYGGPQFADAFWAGEPGMPETPAEAITHLQTNGYTAERAHDVMMASLVTRIAKRHWAERSLREGNS